MRTWTARGRCGACSWTQSATASCAWISSVGLALLDNKPNKNNVIKSFACMFVVGGVGQDLIAWE